MRIIVRENRKTLYVPSTPLKSRINLVCLVYLRSSRSCKAHRIPEDWYNIGKGSEDLRFDHMT